MNAARKTQDQDYSPLRITQDFAENPLNIVRDVESNTSTNVGDHNDVLEKLLEQIFPINFAALAGVEERELKNPDYHRLCVEHVLNVAKKNNWDFSISNGSIYLFNGCYWAIIEEEIIRRFLGRASEKMGVRRNKSDYYNFADFLLKQFRYKASVSTPSRKDSVLINLQNGTFEICDGVGKLRPFDSRDFLTYQLPFAYDLTAKAPKFEKYINRVLPDESKRSVLAEYLGYVLARNLKLSKVLFLYGVGANGKSVLFEIIISLLGRNNVSGFSLTELTNENGYYRAKIVDKILNYVSETGSKMESALFKQLVSGEEVSARLPYGEPMTISNYAKLIFNCNELPKQGIENTHAFFRRFIIILFDVVIPEGEQNPTLHKEIISDELPGVFNWILAGLDRLITMKEFTPSEAIKKEVEAFKKDSDNVALFIDEYGYKKSETNFIKLADLYSNFRTYCAVNGNEAMSNKKFSSRLKNLGFKAEHKREGMVIYTDKM